MVQNMGCRVISNLKKHDHVSNAVKEMHWLKVQEWIQYNVLVTMYQCVNGLAPSFLTNLLDLDLTRKHFKSDTQGNFQYLAVVSPKFVTVQSGMQDQDYGMNDHNIYGLQIHWELSKVFLKHICLRNLMTAKITLV